MFSLISWLLEKLGAPENFVEHYLHVVTSCVVALVITALSMMVWRRYRDTEKSVIPPSRLTIAGLFEIIIENILGLMRELMGKRADQYFPLIGALFIYILISNMMGLLPGFVPPTDNINTNLACAATVFIYYNVVGIRAQGIKNYIHHMAGPIIWLAPLMLAIELISHLVRPASLSIRLFGNMTGDHMVLEIFSSFLPVVLPVVFMAFGMFIAFVQAFVFTLLSMVYIALATEEAH